MSGLTDKIFVCNHRRGDSYHATIQNRTAQIVTVTATNMDVQSLTVTPIFDGLPAAVTINPGDIAAINSPVEALNFSVPLVAASGDAIYVVEAA